MSWELASFIVLGGVLIAGFAWYERSRPPSQVVALVAGLAALAVAGRVALAPIPNVVPTTDILIFAGYALGPAAGFAVGAISAVVSNFWLGQGPWTPWQMGAWGLAGILGALLYVLTRGRPNRWVLAAACGAMGILFGAIMNFSLMASYGGELSAERFLVLQSRAVPFDVAHAVGNVALALIAGPAMVRMLTRFRDRFQWHRAHARLATVAGATLAGLALLAAPVQAADTDAATTWLKGAQNNDGGFPDTPGEASSIAMTGWAMLGLEATGINPLDVTKDESNPVSYLRANVDRIRTPGDIARTVLALTAAEVDVRDFEGRNLLEELRDRKADNGSFQGFPNSTAYAVLALRASDSKAGLGRSLRWLRDVQGKTGGWGDVPRSPGNADSTGSVLQVVQGSRASRKGVNYLRKVQQKDGGFRLGQTGAINTQSTAWAIQGLLASGVDPGNVRAGGNSTLDYLDARQQPDGHFRYSKQSDITPVWVTSQALVAVSGQSFPLEPVERLPEPVDPPDDTSTTPSAPTFDGVTSPSTPSFSTPSIPSSSGSGGNPGSSGSGTGAGASPGIGPVGPGVAADGGAESEDLPGAEFTPALTQGKLAAGADGPAPLPPIAIGLATGLAALVGTWYLGRRRVW